MLISQDNDKIIKNNNVINFKFKNDGLGYEYFRSMKINKNNIAQYIVDINKTETYEELLLKCIRTSLHLKLNNITKDDIICICTYNHENSCVPFIASIFLGIKVASLDPSLSVNDTAHLINLVKPKIIFVVPEAVELIKESLNIKNIQSELIVFGKSDKYESFENYLEPLNDEDIFMPETAQSIYDTIIILFSSGTTGLPKGICINHYAVLTQASNLMYLFKSNDDDQSYCNNSSNIIPNSGVSLVYSSLYWISSVIFLTTSIISGTGKVVCEKFDGEKIWDFIQEYKICFVFLAPFQALEMCKAGRPNNIDTTSLLTLWTGGTTMPEKQQRKLRDLLPGTFLSQIYGQTEVAGAITYFKMNNVKDILYLHNKPRSCGRPIPGYSYKIVDPDTEELLGPNQQGELRIKSKCQMNGYYNLDSSETFDANGWLKTGDIVYYDEDFCFYIVDRIKEMLKYKSWHVAPALLEQIIINHPAVKKVVVIGIPDEEDGDHPMAIIVLEDEIKEISAKEIEDYVAERVNERQKLRAGVKFINNIPLTPSGKVNRRQIRDMMLKGEI